MMQIAQDIDGYTSSKRAAMLLCVVMIVASWVANVFFSIIIDPNILNAVTAIGGVSGVGIACERFGKIIPTGIGSQGGDP
jgi:hypothetical protein